MRSTEKATPAIPAVVFKDGDYVLYRDPSMYWAGKSGHTFVCRIERAWMSGSYGLIALVSGRVISHVRSDYMRLLAPADAMRDIDTAPLHTAGAADGMTAAAVAWLTQQHTTAHRQPELPPQHD